MVIQSNMSSKAIVQVWVNTDETFKKYKVPISEKILERLVDKNVLSALLIELNTVVGSSDATCIEGG
jgi:hypothetical protein